MKKVILLMFLLTLLVCCNKEDSEQDYTAFLNFNVPGFTGDRDGNPFNWKFTWENRFHAYNGSINGPSIPHNLNENERILIYSLVDQNSNVFYVPDFCNTNDTHEIKDGIDLSSSKYNFISDDNLNSTLEMGRKNIGNLENAFKITVYIGSKKYCVRDYNEGIQILKTEKIEDSNYDYILVWLVLDDIVLDSYDDNSSITISNGKIIAKFITDFD